MRLKAGDFEGLTFRIRKNVATAAEQIRTRGEYFSSLLGLNMLEGHIYCGLYIFDDVLSDPIFASFFQARKSFNAEIEHSSRVIFVS